MWAIGTSRERGFTLLELLVVIALIGLLASVGAQTMLRSRTNLDRQADRVERSLYKARQQAWESGLPVSIACARLAGEPIGPGTGDASGASCRRGQHPVDWLMFYPDGSSSGETIQLRADDDHIRLSVDWLSGDIARD